MEHASKRWGDRLPRPVLLGILPLHTSRHAEFLHNEVPGITIPDRVRAAMAAAGERGAEVGLEMAMELLTEMRPLVQGTYIMPSFGRYELGAELVRRLRAAEPVRPPSSHAELPSSVSAFAGNRRGHRHARRGRPASHAEPAGPPCLARRRQRRPAAAHGRGRDRVSGRPAIPRSQRHALHLRRRGRLRRRRAPLRHVHPFRPGGAHRRPGRGLHAGQARLADHRRGHCGRPGADRPVEPGRRQRRRRGALLELPEGTGQADRGGRGRRRPSWRASISRPWTGSWT